MCSTLHVPLLKIPPGFPVPLRGTQQTSFVRSAPLVSIARVAGGTKGMRSNRRTPKGEAKLFKIPNWVTLLPDRYYKVPINT